MVAAKHQSKGSTPLWLGNLLAFGLLIVLMLLWFGIQARQAQQTFQEEAGRQAKLVAEIVSLHAQGALTARSVTDGIVTAFLGNTARFVDYLDSIEPFQADELRALADESGLSLIRIIRSTSSVQSDTPALQSQNLDCTHLEQLLELPQQRTLVLAVASAEPDGCVLVGMNSHRIDELREAVGLQGALTALSGLPGVVRVDKQASNSSDKQFEVILKRDANGRTVASTRTPLKTFQLALDLDAGPLLRREAVLWRDLAGISLLLIALGGLSTWLLYKRQQNHEQQLLAFEQQLSHQREEAALGRAAAVIAHEIRNPLNAMSMGLQRLAMEASNLNDDQKHLLNLIQQSLQRTDGTVRELLDYARPHKLQLSQADMSQLLSEQLQLYRGQFHQRNVQLQESLPTRCLIEIDADLIRQLLDNLLKNALEALADHGEITINLNCSQTGIELILANDGSSHTSSAMQQLCEPWFTTKAEGSGLGLAICSKIATAHTGKLELTTPKPGWFCARLYLPKK